MLKFFILLHNKLYSHPAVLFPMVNESHSQTFSLFADSRNVFYVESAHIKFRTLVHACCIGSHIIQQNITVDISYDDVERLASFKKRCITQFYCDV